MSLNERRKIKEWQDVTLPERVKEIAEIRGSAIPYDLDGLNFMDNLSRHRLNMALRVFRQDDMGKEAVRESIKKVKLKNVKTKPEMAIRFAGGTLEMHCAYSLHTDGMYGDGEIRELLMKN